MVHRLVIFDNILQIFISVSDNFDIEIQSDEHMNKKTKKEYEFIVFYKCGESAPLKA